MSSPVITLSLLLLLDNAMITTLQFDFDPTAIWPRYDHSTT